MKNSRTQKPTRATTMEVFLSNFDFNLLKKQKTSLINIQSKMQISNVKFTQKDWKILEGMLNLIDTIQDIAVDEYGYKETLVFNSYKEKPIAKK